MEVSDKSLGKKNFPNPKQTKKTRPQGHPPGNQWGPLENKTFPSQVSSLPQRLLQFRLIEVFTSLVYSGEQQVRSSFSDGLPRTVPAAKPAQLLRPLSNGFNVIMPENKRGATSF